ncbi:MAG TPA: ACT domain-containing protein [Patescibacteria group bacterium]|nr:ACT domain-containing protein [Patescibacteria group bacterium]
MTQQLDDLIRASSFVIKDGIFVYAKVKNWPNGNHFMVAKDEDEITVVTESRNLPLLDLIERNKDDYRLIALNVSIPFYCIGFLAKVSETIAECGMNILIVSTYSKDYILVKADRIIDARNTLLKLGFSENRSV